MAVHRRYPVKRTLVRAALFKKTTIAIQHHPPKLQTPGARSLLRSARVRLRLGLAREAAAATSLPRLLV
jgi:hypothetical protein